MQRKRKLTASFLEIPEEKDALQRCWRSGEHSDWELALGEQAFKVHKIMVATGERASAFLAAAIRKHLGESKDRTDLTALIPKPCWPYFEAVLDFIYTDKLNLEVENWGPLVKMADVLQMAALYTKCVEAGNDLLTGDEAAKHAPRLAKHAFELQLGGQLQQEVFEIAVDFMAACFKSYSAELLAAQPVEVLQNLLSRDDLEVDNEDAIFDFLLAISTIVDKAHMELLWRCCRLHRLSPGHVLEVALINEIPKQAVVWALASQVQQGPMLTPAPAWAKSWAEFSNPRGREIVFVIPNAANYASKRFIRSESHRLLDRFSWRLLIFPNGTSTETGKAGTTAAFVELVPDANLEEWTVKGIKYTITLVNWKDEQYNVTKEHKFHFKHTEVDNGWHRGFLTSENMTAEQGWLNERGELQFRGTICARKADVQVSSESSPDQNKTVTSARSRAKTEASS
eukprot:TRINITY_DN27217_c0_g5_i1.p1 TRINITY_DN27217_c0_g5~~TRINITY_DN27217_c0_g5_i1.p1  ORF type:complete len:455 (+),score=128.72 TRINITY_DN27217_c0_g5_i1:56-1420(+)